MGYLLHSVHTLTEPLHHPLGLTYHVKQTPINLVTGHLSLEFANFSIQQDSSHGPVTEGHQVLRANSDQSAHLPI